MVAKKSDSDAISNVADLRELIAVSNRRKAELLADASAALDQIVRPTKELCQAWTMISTHSKELVNVAQLKTWIKNLKENFEFYKASEEGLKGELVRASEKSMRIVALFDSPPA